LKSKSKPDESNFRGNFRVGLGTFTEDHSPLRVDLQILAGPEENRREHCVLVRIGRKVTKKVMNFVPQGIPPAIHDIIRIERRMDVETFVSVSRENRPKGSRN